jgi:EcsC protein family
MGSTRLVESSASRTEIKPQSITAAISADDLAALRKAVFTLEHPSLAARLASLAGTPLNLLTRALPAVATSLISRSVAGALKAATRVALSTLPKTTVPNTARGNGGGALSRSGAIHKGLAVLSGAVGGTFGLASLPVELPVSTTLILRAVADIAREEGEDLSNPETALACLQVFALGGRAETDDFTESSYFAVRGALAKTISEATRYIAERGLLEEGAPIVVRFAAQIASRFGIVVSQKVAAQAVPIIGALGGAAVNAAFMAHFQSIARAHFAVRRLERQYGKALVQVAYEQLRASGSRAQDVRE